MTTILRVVKLPESTEPIFGCAKCAPSQKTATHEVQGRLDDGRAKVWFSCHWHAMKAALKYDLEVEDG